MTEMITKNMPDRKIVPEISKEVGEAVVPPALRRPLVPNLTRMLTGQSLSEEILDPDNPNLIMDRDR